MKALLIAFLGSLVYQVPSLLPLLHDHLEDQNNEILPHLFMAEITRWILVRFRNEGDNDKILQTILNELEKVFGNNDYIDELISVSFLENLPHEKENEIRRLLGPKLKYELEKLEN